MNTQRALLLVFVVSLVACATVGQDWEKARMLGTIESYEQFLRKHPQSELSGQAREKIEELAWEHTQRLSTREAYLSFLQKHPTSKHLNQLLANLRKYATPQSGYVIQEFQEISFLTYQKYQSNILGGHVGDAHVPGTTRNAGLILSTILWIRLQPK